MLPEHGMASGNADRNANRRPHCIPRRSFERKNPLNAQFERQVARLESRQREQRCIIFTVFPLEFYWTLTHVPPLHAENGNNHLSSDSTSPVDSLKPSPSTSPPMIRCYLNMPDESQKTCSDNSLRPPAAKPKASENVSNSDFLVNNFTKTSTNTKQTARKKSKKKSKRHKQSHCRKLSGEAQRRESKNAPSAIDIAEGEALTLSPKGVGDRPFEDTSSPGSSGKEGSLEAPDSENDNEYPGSLVASISGTSCSHEMELSRPTTSDLEFSEQLSSNNCGCSDNTSNSIDIDSSLDGCNGDSSWNCNDDTGTLLNVRNECEYAPSELTDFGGSSNGVDGNWLDKSSRGNILCYQNGVGTWNGVESGQLCSDAGDNGEFRPVISRRRRKRKMPQWRGSDGEYVSNVIHGQNERYSPRQMLKELNTKDCFGRPSNVGIHPQNGVALKDSTKDFIQKPRSVCIRRQHEVLSKDCIARASLNHLAGWKENNIGKSQKQTNLVEVANSEFSKVQHVDSSNMLSKTVHTGETDGCQMRSSSASEEATQKFIDGSCTSESSELTNCIVSTLSRQETGLQSLLRMDGATDTDASLPSPGMTSSLDHLHNFADNECKPQVDNTTCIRVCSMECDLHTQAASSQSTQYDLEVGCGAGPAVEGDHNSNDQNFGSSGQHLVEMNKAANGASEVQAVADVHLASGYPNADFETFIYSATPVISQIPCMKSGNCLLDRLVGDQPCQHQISNVPLRSMWEWYEEPGCYGLEVKAHDCLSAKRSSHNSSEFSAYFVPYLSAVQLFGQSRKNLNHNIGAEEEALLEASKTVSYLSSRTVFPLLPQPTKQSNECLLEPSLSAQDHGELLFEYFESEQPALRPPLFLKIKELVSGVNPSDCQTSGDPEKLENVKLCDLHPASWFSVAWYPTYRIPHGNFRAAFLTYHSLGKLVPQTCSPDMAAGCSHIICPVVGLQSYNNKGEQWFQLRDTEFNERTLDDVSKIDCAEVLKERLLTLSRGASAMARAVTPRGTGESVNRHPDYEFFLSRST